MKINEVEAAVGVTKKNIRFYEEEGLISPRREHGSGRGSELLHPASKGTCQPQ